MSSLIGKLTRFAQSPKGQRMIGQATTKAQQLSNDPKTRAKLQGLLNKRGGKQL